MGKHVDTLTVEQMANARFYYLVSVWPALLAITVPKVAVAGLIIRIFTPDVWTKTIMSGVVCIGVLNYIVISALSTFQCQPLAAAWDPRVRAEKCVSAKIYLDLCYFTSCLSSLFTSGLSSFQCWVLTSTYSAYSASVDCYLAIYPALVFRKMGFSIIKKIGLSVVLGLGIGVTAVACLKISYLHVLSNADFTCEYLSSASRNLKYRISLPCQRDDPAAHHLDNVRASPSPDITLTTLTNKQRI